jgi:glycosyltransferase involved in cell wall biosynthesis
MNTTSQPPVSIVTPVYNEEKYIGECIESVLAQTYQNWDYTIVNNCSTDKSMEIASRYAAADSRIRIHENKRFLNIVANHNLSVQQISPASKYCKVVLGDDWIFPECLEKMVAVAEACPSVGVVSAYQLHGEQVRSTGLSYQTMLVSGREACRQFLLQKYVLFGTPTSVLYRADLVRNQNPFYLETEMCCADWEACLALLSTSDLGFVHQVLTFSRQRTGSVGAIASDTGGNLASLLRILLAYGRKCLTKEDFEKALELRLSQYYEFLGRRLWVERDKDFWAYHRKTFANAGIGFSRVRLARGALGHLCRSVLDPKATLKRVRKLFSLRAFRNRKMRQVVLEAGVSSCSGPEDRDVSVAPISCRQTSVDDFQRG